MKVGWGWGRVGVGVGLGLGWGRGLRWEVSLGVGGGVCLGGGVGSGGWGLGLGLMWVGEVWGVGCGVLGCEVWGVRCWVCGVGVRFWCVVLWVVRGVVGGAWCVVCDLWVVCVWSMHAALSVGRLDYGQSLQIDCLPLEVIDY